jgi:O-antigen ligase
VGTSVAIVLLAVLMGQKRRLSLYAVLALALFSAAVPVLGLDDYLLSVKTGQDPSAQGHQESIIKGLEYVAEHPFGSGAGNAGMFATKTNEEGVFIENTYLTLAAEYGILAALCFLGFLFTALRTAWRQRTELGLAAVGIVVGFGAVMLLAPLHNVFSLASWIWFPVGMAVRISTTSEGGSLRGERFS